MIRIVHTKTGHHDNGTIATLEFKFKSQDENGNELPDPALVSKIMSAFLMTTFLKEENRGVKIINGDEGRINIVADLIIKLGNNSLTRTDVARLTDKLEIDVNAVKIF